MEHRRLLGEPGALRGFRGSDLFVRIGGYAAVEAIVDGLYDRIETDAPLRRLFGRHLENERAGQKRFFVEWLGGEARYSDRAYMPLFHRHELLPITRELAEQWVALFRDAMEDVLFDEALTSQIYDKVRALAFALVNEGDRVAQIRAQSHGTCLRYRPAIEALGLARRGDVAALRGVLEDAPDVLASVAHAARLMHVAVVSGRTCVVELLVERGVSVNSPSDVAPLVFVTPLCAARMKRRTHVEEFLLARGAQEDVFTHAFLGDIARLKGDAAFAQALDPAVDALEITPVHHAVAGGQVEALRVLLEHASGPIINGGRALREAAARANVAMVKLLVERGVDATLIGAGRWVLHPEMAPMLAAAGACVDRSGGWIGLACTGNQGRKDDPALVAALLRYGARADDRRLVGQDNDGGRATALHYAAKAGFVKTIAVLLEHGADPGARDDNGLTPLDWLERAAKSVDRAGVRRALVG